jgi:CxxC motif-containing protein (DUF1111 family)
MTWASGSPTASSQGAATGREFRTAPLWGLGQRIFFLHDGRTSDLKDAIQAHSSNGSEANAVISKFNGLSEFQKQGPVQLPPFAVKGTRPLEHPSPCARGVLEFGAA